MKDLGRLLLAGSLMVLLGCQKSSDYLHYVKDEPPRVLNFTHKVKELQGESRVDILWIIDNSGSMWDHQQAVIRNADLFMQEFVKNNSLDWKMGLISTDERDQPYVGFQAGNEVNSQSQNPVTIFNAAVSRLGISGSGYEKPFQSIQNTLTQHGSFLRRNAILALILVTDAEEQSGIPAPTFMSFLQQLKGDLKRVVVYGVLGPNDFGCPSTDSSWNYAGSPYEELIQKVTGKTYPLCSPNFGQNLAELGKDLVKRVQSPRIRLKSRPQVETLQVWHKGEPLPGGSKEDGGHWYYDFDLNAVVFHDLDFAPGDDEKVEITYEEARHVSSGTES